MSSPPATEKQMKDAEFYGSVGEVRMIADLVENCSLAQGQEVIAKRALAAGIAVCRKHGADKAVRSVLERHGIPEHIKVEMIYVCGEIGWAKPVREWNPRMTEQAAREAARKTLEAIGTRFGGRDIALEPKIRPQGLQKPQLPANPAMQLAGSRG